MDSDPYTTPEAEVTVPVTGSPRPIRGIVIALLFDHIGTTVAVVLLSILYGGILAAQGLSAIEANQILMSYDLLSPWNLFLACVGLGFSYYSGRICIQVSRGTSLLYPGILAGIGALLTVALMLPDYEIGASISLTLLNAGFVLVGAKSELKVRNTDA